jgi:hypothetical protein
MKINPGWVAGLCMLAQGAVFAAGAQDDKMKREVAYEPNTVAVVQTARSTGCKVGEPGCKTLLETRSCGAFVQSKSRYGYGFGPSQEQATSRARDMCGGEACQVVVAACEE